MKTIRWIFTILFSLILSIVVLLGIPVGTLAHIVNNAERVKSLVGESGIYDNTGDILSDIVPMALESSEGEGMFNIQEKLQNEESEMIGLIEGILTPEFLKTNTEKSIDAFYSWFKRESEYPKIEINLAEDKEKITDILLLSLSSKIENLPVCRTDLIVQGDMNPFEMECKPEGFDVDTFREEMEEQLSKEEVDSQENSVFDQFMFKTKKEDFRDELTGKVQSVYKIATFVPIIIIGGVIFLLLLIILLIPNVKTKFIYSGILLILTSIPASLSKLIIVSNFKNIINIVINQFSQNGGSELEDISGTTIFNVIETITANILKEISVVGLVVLLFGVVIIIVGVVIKPKIKEKEREIKEIEVKEETKTEEVKSN